MKKISSLFQRNYEGDGLVRNEVVPGAEWVLDGYGVATRKYDGTCCLVRDGKLYKRYDRKLTDKAQKRRKQGHTGPWALDDFKPFPDGWEACERTADMYTGHWPGWLLVGDGPEDKWHREAWATAMNMVRITDGELMPDGTYELCGPAIQGNPEGFSSHIFIQHGLDILPDVPRTFDDLREYLRVNEIEGIVWHHSDGRMAKLKRSDFGFEWPRKRRIVNAVIAVTT